MATIKKLEEIESWQVARELCKIVYVFINKEGFNKDYKLRDQINSASGSVMDNIAEGFGRGGNKEFSNFLSFSKGSAEEVRSQLYRAFDRNYISKEEFNKGVELVESVKAKITGFMIYLSKTEIKGTKYIAREDEVEYFD